MKSSSIRLKTNKEALWLVLFLALFIFEKFYWDVTGKRNEIWIEVAWIQYFPHLTNLCIMWAIHDVFWMFHFHKFFARLVAFWMNNSLIQSSWSLMNQSVHNINRSLHDASYPCFLGIDWIPHKLRMFIDRFQIMLLLHGNILFQWQAFDYSLHRCISIDCGHFKVEMFIEPLVDCYWENFP